MPFWLAAIVVTIVLLGTAELMYRAGIRKSHVYDDERVRTQITTVQASTLGLLALILGFTMSMAEARFDTRRSVLVAEAGAVSRAYLFSDALPDPPRSESRELLRRYVAARRAYFGARGEGVEAATRAAQDIHVQLRAIAATLGREHPDWDLTASYIDAVAEVVRLEGSRELVLRARVPTTVHAVLLAVALVAVGISALATGMARTRSFLTLFVVPILIAFAYLMILDIDRSRAGLITTGDAPMRRLQEVMTTGHTDTSAAR